MTMKNLIFATGMLSLFFLMGCSNSEETYTVKKSDIVESVYSSVIIEPSALYLVNASNSGYIDELHVKTGDDVAFGQVILTVRDIQSNNTASNARLAYEMAQSNFDGDVNLLEDLRLELSDAFMKKINDSTNFIRSKKLLEKGLMTQVEYDQSEMVFESSKTRSKLIMNKIKRSEKDLKTSLSQARNNYNSSQSRSEDALVRTKIEGKVYDVFKESGEFVMMQEPVAMIGSKDSFILKMRIDEVDITKVKLGQTIIVALEAYKKQTFKAKITRISPKMDPQTQTFEIEGEFIKAPDVLFMGLTGEGNIIIVERKGALVIPLEYLTDDNSVTTANGKVKVTTGSRSLSHVEILTGLKEGDVIHKPE